MKTITFSMDSLVRHLADAFTAGAAHQAHIQGDEWEDEAAADRILSEMKASAIQRHVAAAYGERAAKKLGTGPAKKKRGESEQNKNEG